MRTFLKAGERNINVTLSLTPGTIIAVPAEVKHWHGAQKDSWFQHLTYHKDVQEGASNEWLEPVDDATYRALK